MVIARRELGRAAKRAQVEDESLEAEPSNAEPAKAAS
jgi:hypothetical protein